MNFNQKPSSNACKNEVFRQIIHNMGHLGKPGTHAFFVMNQFMSGAISNVHLFEIAYKQALIEDKKLSAK